MRFLAWPRGRLHVPRSRPGGRRPAGGLAASLGLWVSGRAGFKRRCGVALGLLFGLPYLDVTFGCRFGCGGHFGMSLWNPGVVFR